MAVLSAWSQRPDALLRLILSTHSEGGLTDADHALARRIDEVTSG
jgi:pterin-4a-carbinolamine dehydratase